MGTARRGSATLALHADIWSCYIEERALLDEVAPRLESFEAICAEVGRTRRASGEASGSS